MEKDNKIVKEIQENQRKKQVIFNKTLEDERLQSRKLLRKALQFKSNQMLDSFNNKAFLEEVATDEQTINRLASKKPIRIKIKGTASNKWNDFSNTSKKYVNMVLTDQVIKNDEKAIETIERRFKKEQELQEIQKKCFEKNREKIRDTFHKQHLKNYLFEKKIGLIPKDHPEKNNSDFPIKYYSLHKRTVSAKIDKLADSKKNSFSELDMLSNIDFKGLYIGDVEDKTFINSRDNNFVNKLSNTNKFQEKMQLIKSKISSTQTSRSMTRPNTAYSTPNLTIGKQKEKKNLNLFSDEVQERDFYENREKLIEELSDFESKNHFNKKLYYPNVRIFDTTLFTNQEMLKKLKEIEVKEQRFRKIKL